MSGLFFVVMPRLDRGIQSYMEHRKHTGLDCPAKPGNDRVWGNGGE